jgi:hypothetical protein
MCSFAYADLPGELPVSGRRCDGPFIGLSAVRLRVRRRCELRWHLFVLELIYVMLELFTARFFSKHPTMSKPDIPESGCLPAVTVLVRGIPSKCHLDA